MVVQRVLDIWSVGGQKRAASRKRKRKRVGRNHHVREAERLEARAMLALTNTVPGPQTAFIDAYQFGNYAVSKPIAFTAALGNGISVSHDTLGTNPLKVTLTVDAGALTLVHPNPNGGITYRTGDGYEDATITFEGTLADVNKALSWVGYTPPAKQYFQWTVANGGNGHWYKFVSGSKTWTQARDEATAGGGYLATVTSSAESTFVNALVYDLATTFWLGGYQDRSSLTYIEPAGGWRWVTSEPWNYTNWNAGDPSNSGGSEDYLAGNWAGSGKWVDIQATNARPGYIVEYDSDPRPSEKTQATLTLSTDDLGFLGTRQIDTDSVTIALQPLPSFAGPPNYSTSPAALDATFGTNGVVTLDLAGGIDYVTDMRVMADGKLVAVGAANNRVGVLRFNPDGTLDPTFGPNGNGGVQVDVGNGVVPIEMQVDLRGRLLVLTGGTIIRLTANGLPDSSFGAAGVLALSPTNAKSLRVNPQNDYLVASAATYPGTAGNENPSNRFQIYTETGVLLQDVFYNVRAYIDESEQVAVAYADGSVLVVSDFYNLGQGDRLESRRYVTSSPGYTSGTSNSVGIVFDGRSTLTLPDGRILIVGSSNSDFFVCRLLSDGRLDTTFGANGVSRVNILNAADEGWRATLTADGKVLVAGYGYNGVNNDICLIQMSYDGIIDQSFGSDGRRWLNLGADERGYAVASLTDGKILVAGRTGNDIALVRLLGNAITPSGPSGIALSATSVAEAAIVGSVVGTLAASDTTAGDTFTYAFVSGPGATDNGSFTLDGNVLKTAAIFDFEVKNSYSIRVRVTDTSGLYFEKTFTITVTQSTAPPTDIVLAASNVPENSEAGTTVGVLTATDPDNGDMFTYALVPGIGSTDNASFTIDGNVLKTVATFDFEAKNAYSIRVRATDAGHLFLEKILVIAITNANDAPTDITLAPASIAENSAVGDAVGVFSTSDVDADNTYTYSLVHGPGDVDNLMFQIAGNQLRANGVFDYEARSSYSVRVRSADQGGLATEKIFTISITNVTEPAQAPTVTVPAGFTVQEDTASALVFAATPFIDVDSPAAKLMTVTLFVADGVIAAASANGVTVGGTPVARTFSGSREALNAFFTAVPGRIVYTPKPNSSAARTLTTRIAEAHGAGVLASAATSLITVLPINDAPAVQAPAMFTVTEDVKGSIPWPAILTPFADVDAARLTVTLSVADGTIAAVSTATVAVGGTATARTFSGTPVSLNAFFKKLGSIGYTTARDNTVPRTLTTTVSDGFLSASTSTQIRIRPVNDAPMLVAAATFVGGRVGTPYEITYEALRTALNATDPETASPLILFQAVNTGILQKWNGTAWVRVNTASTAPLGQRSLAAGQKVRWVPPAGVSGVRAAFRARAYDGVITSVGAAQVNIDLVS
jgi:uncharacterized delta-60 repeat protein